jgi:hypothetical protein
MSSDTKGFNIYKTILPQDLQYSYFSVVNSGIEVRSCSAKVTVIFCLIHGDA